MKKHLLLLLTLVCLGFSKNTITVTTKPYEKIIQEIAGDGYEVRSFVPAGVDAHHFHPTRARVQMHAQDSIWFGTGEPLERHLKMASSFVDLKRKGNHPWLDPVALKEQFAHSRDALIERYPSDRALFEKNFQRVASRLDALEAKVRRKLAHSKPILAYHPFLDGFCARFDVELISLEHEGKGMSQKAFERAAERVRKLGITKLIAAPGDGNAARIAEKLGVEVAILDPYGEDVFETIEKSADLAAR